MLKFIFALAAISAGVAAFVVDWRAAGLMILGWWMDNILKVLREREKREKGLV